MDGNERSQASDGQASRKPPPLVPGLHIVATPIGNLRDITLRALDVLREADLIACEDTRVFAKLASHYGIAAPTVAYSDATQDAAEPRIVRALAAGKRVALVSDAGMPLISDPGYRLVRAALAAGHAVTAVPGPSAVPMALALAGLPTDRFFFEGFLPPKDAARRKRIAELARIPATLVLFESGPRVAAALAALAAELGDRAAAVCRELTKLHEEIRRGGLAELAGHYAEGGETRGEFVLVIAPPAAPAPSAADVDALLRAALRSQTLKDAVGAVAAATGEPRQQVYRRALALAKERRDDD
jgi:16S rRNA (cytidine1402-2'-O)-methyltransferase